MCSISYKNRHLTSWLNGVIWLDDLMMSFDLMSGFYMKSGTGLKCFKKADTLVFLFPFDFFIMFLLKLTRMTTFSQLVEQNTNFPKFFLSNLKNRSYLLTMPNNIEKRTKRFGFSMIRVIWTCKLQNRNNFLH